MLNCLQIRDFAIIDELELELGPGLNVLTGETGAGKSILMGALELVLGGKGRPEQVRAGAKRAEVEALFEVGDDPRLRQAFEAMDISDGELVVRRVVMPNGRTRAFVNGRLATRGQLAALTRGLVDIASQHLHHTLIDPGTHLEYLDAFAGLGTERAQVRGCYLAFEKARAKLSDFEARLKDRSMRESLLTAAVSEIEAAEPISGEDERLEEESARLRHSESLLRLIGEAAELLYERDESASDLLAQVTQRLGEATALDPALFALTERMEAVHAALQDMARDLSHQLHSICPDPDAVERIEQRLFELSKLKRRYGGTLEAVLQHLDGCRSELEELAHHVEAEQALRAAHAEAWREATRAARSLSAKRRRAATRLADAITHELESLGMSEARLEVEVRPLGERASAVQVGSRGGEDGLRGCGVPKNPRLGPSGMDRVEFLIAPNRGEEALPLSKVASGGELSRTMLAIKCVLSDLAPAGMVAFDEVDSGVGGAVAEIIGRKIQAVARHRQVLCVTHLPQIAVFADQHYKVEKSLRAGRTLSSIVKLGGRERREEIARMLGGLTITQKTRAAARELLQHARRSAA